MSFGQTNVLYSWKHIDVSVPGKKERHLRINLGKNMIL